MAGASSDRYAPTGKLVTMSMALRASTASGDVVSFPACNWAYAWCAVSSCCWVGCSLLTAHGYNAVPSCSMAMILFLYPFTLCCGRYCMYNGVPVGAFS